MNQAIGQLRGGMFHIVYFRHVRGENGDIAIEAGARAPNAAPEMTAESTMGMLPPTEAHSGMTTAATGSVEPQLVPDMKASMQQILQM